MSTFALRPPPRVDVVSFFVTARYATHNDRCAYPEAVSGGSGTYSIAALLPARPPKGLRIVVAGRPHPPIPHDVPDGHPLRGSAVVRALAPSRHAQVVRSAAERNLKRLLHGDCAGQDLLGLVTAAGGGLSRDDLAELTGLLRHHRRLWDLAATYRRRDWPDDTPDGSRSGARPGYEPSFIAWSWTNSGPAESWTGPDTRSTP
ncbi:hypothetical protein [Streptomyces sp. NPDC048606]|uniref:hypothetical protein n=1 Tax=Streptomyces sp. NPDC048606 TaxID=3154726 RepID=UPI00342961AE